MPYLKNVHWVDSGRRLRDRFLKHLTDLPTGRHFTSPGHSVGDMLLHLNFKGNQQFFKNFQMSLG